MNDANINADAIRLQPVSVTRKMAAALPGLRAIAERRGLKIHHLGAGYPHPEVTDPTNFLQSVENWFAHLAAKEGLNDASSTPAFLRESYGYADTMGPLSPRETFAQVYGADWNVSLDPARLIPTIGATGGIALTCSLFERSNQPVAYITDAPTYAGFVARATLNQSAQIFSIELDDDGPDPSEFERQIQSARDSGYYVPFYYTVPDGHNPAGISFSARRRQELLEIAQREEILIVEDAPYLYINYASEAERPLPFVSLAPDQTIHLFTGSKIGLPGPRIGFAYTDARMTIADGELIHVSDLLLTEASADILCHNSRALLEFESLFREPDGSVKASLWPVAEQKLSVYRENRKIVLDGLKENLGGYPDTFSWTEPDAGFFSVFSVNQPTIRADDEFIDMLTSEYGVVVVPMYDFYPSDARERNPNAGFNQLRISFCFSESTGDERRRDLREAVEAFSTAMLKLTGLAQA